jgi:putative nucleotidyltransferase with HDIG domain
MIKKIRLDQLKVGMFIHDFNCAWIDHPFLTSHMLVTGEERIAKIAEAGIRELYIDTGKGLDADDAPTMEESRAALEQELLDIAGQRNAQQVRVTVAEELVRAEQIKDRAHYLVRAAMRDARMGRAVELEQVEPVVQQITESILRNPGALAGLLRIKTKDDYTFLHSVTTCALMVAFCRSVGMESETTRQAGLGGLLHDIGKALVPDAILNKPGRLTEEEYAIIKRHPKDGHDILLESGSFSAITLDITLHHHERVDGSGYPQQMQGACINTLTQMAALVDVYDAITSDRCYRKGVPPAEGLRRIYEWSRTEFNPETVQAFIRCIGIYPIGSLVLLESGRLAVVIEAHESNLLVPKVKAFFCTRSNTYIPPLDIDLSRPLGKGGGDRILSHESPEKWCVDPIRFFKMP